MKVATLARYFIGVLSALFCLGYILVSFHTRYMFDDMGFAALVRDNGIWHAFIIQYYSWETIYNSLLVFFLLKWNFYIPPYVYNISILLVNIYCFYLMLKTILIYYKVGMSRANILLLSVLVIGITYYSCRARGFAIYWVTGQIVYCLFLSYLFLGLHFWINGKLLLASVCMFLFAHTRINYDAIFIGLYAGFFAAYWLQSKRIVMNVKAQLPFLFFLIGIITYVIIPGNYARMASIRSPDPNLHLSVPVFLKGYLSAFKHMAGIILSSWKQLMILPVGILLGLLLADNIALRKLITQKLLLYCTLTFILCYIGQSTVIFISLKTPVGYNRIFFMLEMLLFVLMLLYGIYASNLLQQHVSRGLLSSLAGIIFLVIFIAVTFNFYKSFRLTSRFAIAYDKRIQSLKELRLHPPGPVVYVPKLPDSGVLEFMEIEPGTDSTARLPDNNAVYVRYYHLPFKVYLAQ